MARQQPDKDEDRELAELVRAASVCGCAACRRVARLRSIKEQANDAFAHALADLTAAMGLPWIVRNKAA